MQKKTGLTVKDLKKVIKTLPDEMRLLTDSNDPNFPVYITGACVETLPLANKSSEKFLHLCWHG